MNLMHVFWPVIPRGRGGTKRGSQCTTLCGQKLLQGSQLIFDALSLINDEIHSIFETLTRLSTERAFLFLSSNPFPS